MKKHELNVFLIVGVVLVIAVALVYFSGGKLGAASSAIENVKCVFKNSEDQQKCYLAGGPVIVISPPNKVCYGVKECTLKVKSQPGGVAKWKSSCSNQEFKTVVDGKNDVIEFECPTPIEFYVDSPVWYDKAFAVSWSAPDAIACSASGHHVLLPGGGLWTELVNLPPKGKQALIARHANFGYITPLQLTIQCYNEAGEIGRKTKYVQVINPGLFITPEKEEYSLGESVKANLEVVVNGMTVNNLYVYVLPVEGGVVTPPSDKLVASFTDFQSTTLTIPATFMPTAGTYAILTCIDQACTPAGRNGAAFIVV